MMKKLKKALSLTLALALSLALALPAFAAGSTWSLEVVGKSTEETALPTAAYTFRDWRQDQNSDNDRILISEGTRSAEVDGLIGLARGDTITITANPAGVIDVQAYSDPDGDGVYDQHMLVTGYLAVEYKDLPLPYEEGAVLQGVDGMMICPVLGLTNSGVFGEGIAAYLGLGYEDQAIEQVDITVSADYLFQCFGPNTVLFITVGDEELGYESGKGWNLFLMDDGQPTTPAQPEQPAAPSGISVTVGGTAVAWTDAAPFIDANDRTMVPLRAVADAMGLNVDWDASAREAVFTDGSKTIYFPIDSNSARTGDGEAIQMDTAAVITNDRTYAPIRYLAEYFGYKVGWDGAAQTVSLVK